MTQYQDPIKEFAKESPNVVINVQEMVKLLMNLLLEWIKGDNNRSNSKKENNKKESSKKRNYKRKKGNKNKKKEYKLNKNKRNLSSLL